MEQRRPEVDGQGEQAAVQTGEQAVEAQRPGGKAQPDLWAAWQAVEWIMVSKRSWADHAPCAQVDGVVRVVDEHAREYDHNAYAS